MTEAEKLRLSVARCLMRALRNRELLDHLGDAPEGRTAVAALGSDRVGDVVRSLGTRKPSVILVHHRGNLTFIQVTHSDRASGAVQPVAPDAEIGMLLELLLQTGGCLEWTVACPSATFAVVGGAELLPA